MERLLRFVWAILTSPIWIIATIRGLTIGAVQIALPKWIDNLFKKKEEK